MTQCCVTVTTLFFYSVSYYPWDVLTCMNAASLLPRLWALRSRWQAGCTEPDRLAVQSWQCVGLSFQPRVMAGVKAFRLCYSTRPTFPVLCLWAKANLSTRRFMIFVLAVLCHDTYTACHTTFQGLYWSPRIPDSTSTAITVFPFAPNFLVHRGPVGEDHERNRDCWEWPVQGKGKKTARRGGRHIFFNPKRTIVTYAAQQSTR